MGSTQDEEDARLYAEEGVFRVDPTELLGSSTYEESVHPLGGVIWHVQDRDLMLGDGVSSLVRRFIEEYPHADYSLSIFDFLTKKTLEISCDVSEMPSVVFDVYHREKATPLLFVGENLLTDSYVVGMTCTRGRLSFPGSYRVENGRLVRL